MIAAIFWFIVGLVVGWNLIPQPMWVEKLYRRTFISLKAWIESWVLLFVVGCVVAASVGCRASLLPGPVDLGHNVERAMAEIAIASQTAPRTPDRELPSVGDKCPDCNDPPGDCGRGKVGDGRDCSTCGKCNGDGRIDQKDLDNLSASGEIEVPVPDPVPDQDPEATPKRVDREIVLHWARTSPASWPAKWLMENEETFRKRGWIVRFIGEPESVTKTSFFVVVAPDGEIFQFFEPLTVEQVEHLETR